MEKNAEVRLPFACLKCPADNIIELIIDEGNEVYVALAGGLHVAI